MFFIIIAILCVLFSVLLIFYSRHVIVLKKRLANTEKELSEIKEAKRLQAITLRDLKDQIESKHIVDSLTGLVTFSIFEDRLKQILNQSKRHQLTFAVLFLNINEFKMITHALGMEVGNQILKEVAKRLLRCIRQLDTVARLQGEDFALIVAQLARADTAAYVAQRVLDAIAEPFIINEKEIFVAACIGIAIYPNDGDDMRALMKNAETALHQAKAHGHHTYQFFRNDMQLDSQREFILSTGLQQPTLYEQLVLHYQPIVNVEKKTIYAMQALLHWQHPDFGLMEFNEFARLAENTGAIVKMGEWLMRQVFQQYKLWKDEGFDIQTLGLPISLRQLENPHFIYRVSQLLNEFSLQPGNVLFEMDESAITSKVGVSEKSLLMLKELGVQVAISDFGMGNMVLWRLHGFRADCLKIASLMVKNITVDRETESIIKMVIALADTLKLQVIADGVETKKQSQILKNVGCYLMQGNAFCKSFPAGDFTLPFAKTILENITL